MGARDKIRFLCAMFTRQTFCKVWGHVCKPLWRSDKSGAYGCSLYLSYTSLANVSSLLKWGFLLILQRGNNFSISNAIIIERKMEFLLQPLFPASNWLPWGAGSHKRTVSLLLWCPQKRLSEWFITHRLYSHTFRSASELIYVFSFWFVYYRKCPMWCIEVNLDF